MRRAVSPGSRPPCWPRPSRRRPRGQSRSTSSRLAARDPPGAGRGRQLRHGATPPQHHGRHRVAVRAVRSPGHPLHVQGRGAPDAGRRSQFAGHEEAGRGALEGAGRAGVLHVLLRHAAAHGGSAGAEPQGPPGREDPRHPLPHLHGGGRGHGGGGDSRGLRRAVDATGDEGGERAGESGRHDLRQQVLRDAVPPDADRPHQGRRSWWSSTTPPGRSSHPRCRDRSWRRPTKSARRQPR